MTVHSESRERELAAAVDGLFREAQRRRRRLRLTTGAVVCAVTGIVAGVWLSGWGGGATGGGGANSGAVPAPGAVQLARLPVHTTATEAMLDAFLPATGAQFAARDEYSGYWTLASASLASGCLARSGLPPLRATLPPYSGDNMQFPYVSYLAANGFNLGPATPTPEATGGMSAGDKRAYAAAAHRCEQRTQPAATSRISKLGEQLSTSWSATLTRIDSSAAVQRELPGFSKCLAAAGVHATTITAFFSYATHAAHRSGSSTTARSMGQVYAGCVAPLEAVRDSARVQARATFIADHAASISQLEASWHSALVTLQRSGIAWPASSSSPRS